MENNNPFQPTLNSPVDESTLGDMPQSDDFANFAETAPADNVASVNESVSDPLAFELGANDEMAPKTDEASEDNHNVFVNVLGSKSDDKSNDGDTNTDMGMNLGSLAAAEDAKTAEDNNEEKPVDDKKESKADKKAAKEAEKDAKRREKEAKKNDKTGKHEKSPKQVIITLPMIILAILTIVFAILAFIFWQETKSLDQSLEDSTSEISRLTDELNHTSDSTNVSTGQFSSLQDKIAQLTKQQTEDTKTIGDQKAQIEDLNKKLTAANQQANQIKSVTEQIAGLLGNCRVVSGFGIQSPTQCTATIVPQSGNSPAGIDISQKQ